MSADRQCRARNARAQQRLLLCSELVGSLACDNTPCRTHCSARLLLLCLSCYIHALSARVCPCKMRTGFLSSISIVEMVKCKSIGEKLRIRDSGVFRIAVLRKLNERRQKTNRRHYCGSRNDEVPARSRRPFWPSGPQMGPAHEALYLHAAQRHSHL